MSDSPGQLAEAVIEVTGLRMRYGSFAAQPAERQLLPTNPNTTADVANDRPPLLNPTL
jgi:hypothetical protein